MKKKREFQSSELVQKLAKIYGFEDKLLAMRIRDFLQDYLDESLFAEIDRVDFRSGTLEIRIKSPLLRNDFRMRQSFYLKKFQELEGDKITALQVF